MDKDIKKRDIDFDAIVKENRRRNRLFDKVIYNPLKGIGSPVERFELKLTKKSSIYVPEEMKKERFIKDILNAGSLLNLVNNNINNKALKVRKVPPQFYVILAKIRIKYDFEFWAALTINIKDKLTGKRIAFVLNRGQRRLLLSFEKQRLAGKPIRTLLVKARQWGGSTLTEFYAAWLQFIRKKNWNSVIVGDVESQANVIRGMYNYASKYYPKELGDMTLEPFEGSTKNRVIKESGSVISVGSMQKPESLRSQDIKVVHLSEVGLYRKTSTKSPEDLIQTIKGSVPYIPCTMIVEESTAKGIGNYFHRAYKAAKESRNGYDLVFVPWFDIEHNRIKIDASSRAIKFMKTMNEYEWWLWSLGATLDGIKWYRRMLKTEFGNNHWRMKSENPSTADEAFQSTGRRVFPPSIVLEARKNTSEPVAKGLLFSDDDKGEGALRNITFEPTADGEFWIWAFPDKEVQVINRYVVSVDIGGASKDADWSIIRVFDKLWMKDGGKPETVATMKMHIDQDLLAWTATRIAKWYNDALLVFENNSLRKEQNTEGNGYLTVLNEISDYYDNLYLDKRHDTLIEGAPRIYGFHTNTYTKPMIINTLKAALRDEGYIESDERVLDECDEYEYKENNTMGAVDGAHDDLVMSTAIGLWVVLYDSPEVEEIDPIAIRMRRAKAKLKRKNINEASF